MGIDITAEDVYKLRRQVHQRAFLVLAFGVALSFIVGLFVSKRITGPIRKLVEGTRRIGGGEFQHQVEISGDDEMSGLARSFNQMTKNLSETRKKIVDYFYDVVQSMVRVLEAKDHYTRGHSERVSEYAAKIATQLGFSREKIEVLTEMALLHDLGKLGVRDDILLKKGKLTEEEWEVVRQHPIIGEDILKPVAYNEEMLAIIRGHHEFYDGRGYPDQLSGDKIDIFAAIVAVADAFDAMTTDRPYRTALSKEKAIAELTAYRGTQFHPEVVDAFLEILKEEESPPL